MSLLIIMPELPQRLKTIESDFKEAGFTDPIWIENESRYEKKNVEYILAWNPPKQDWSKYPRLKMVQNWGAGVDGLISAEFPKHIAICRFMAKSLVHRIMRYVSAQLSNWQIHLKEVFQNQDQRLWKWQPGEYREKVLILGLGVLGAAAAENLSNQGYEVEGWSRSRKVLNFCTCLSGDDELKTALEEAAYIINLLPLTDETRDFFSHETWKQCKARPVFLNAGRGGSVDEDALLDALDEGMISGAILDVFKEEPLPADHPFWERENVWITPHIASMSEVRDVVNLTLENIRRFEADEELLYQVNPDLQY
jgi:glyoxylate/hydroxypyruvate reductase A